MLGLIIRVLYRLRFLAEQAPFDPATFSYVFPLLEQIIQQGGVSAQEDEEKIEQVTLALDFVKFHCGECEHSSFRVKDCVLSLHIVSNTAFPRKRTLEQLLRVIRSQPKLSKNASSTLIDLGEAISPTATHEEINVLLKGTLAQEPHVRNACLQAIQVSSSGRAQLPL